MGYDDLGRLTDDHTKNSSNATLARRQYGYNADSSIQQAVVTQPGNAAAGTYTFTYDLASRLRGFNGPAGATTYDYDAAGNRTAVNGAVHNYDQRNRLTSGGGTNYNWTPRGTLASTTGTGAASYSYDGLDRLRTAGATTYTYDSLDRVLTRNGTGGFTYAGTETDPATAGTESFLRSPTGQLLAIKRGATTVLAGIDRHGDLAWTLNPATGTIADSRIVDPYGKPLATTGTTSPLGYQADYTDPTTGNVWMAARWYNPNTGTFLSRDTYPGEIGAVFTLNRYAYALGDPLRYWDPLGRFAEQAMALFGAAMQTAVALLNDSPVSADLQDTLVSRAGGAAEALDLVVAGINTIVSSSVSNMMRDRIAYNLRLDEKQTNDAVGGRYVFGDLLDLDNRKHAGLAYEYLQKRMEQLEQHAKDLSWKAANPYRERSWENFMLRKLRGAPFALHSSAERALVDAACDLRHASGWGPCRHETLAKLVAGAVVGSVTFSGVRAAALALGAGSVAAGTIAGCAAGLTSAGITDSSTGSVALGGGLGCATGLVGGFASKLASKGATETGLVKRTGTVEVLGKAKQTELSYADELAGRGYDVTVRGTSAQGGDFIVNGVQWELKTLNSGSQGAVINNVQRGLQQSNRVIIDGRAAGLSHGDALKALERLKGSGSLNNATEIVIETRSGRIGWP